MTLFNWTITNCFPPMGNTTSRKNRYKALLVEEFMSTKMKNFDPSHNTRIDEYRTALEEAFVLQCTLEGSLSTLETPVVFCKRKLREALRKKSTARFRPKDKIKLKPNTAAEDAGHSITLLQAAMLNFTGAEIAPDYYSSDSGVSSSAQGSPDESPNEKITAQAFAELSRSLDMGSEYQKMLKEKFDTPEARENAVKLAILNMRVAAYSKFFSGEINEETWSTIKNLTDRKVDIVNGSELKSEPIVFHAVSLLDKYVANAVALLVRGKTPSTSQYIIYVPDDSGPGFHVYDTPMEYLSKMDHQLRHGTPLANFLAPRMSLVEQATFLNELKTFDEKKDTQNEDVDLAEKKLPGGGLSGKDRVAFIPLKEKGLFAYISTLNLNTFISDSKRIAVPVNEVNQPIHAGRRANCHSHSRPTVSEKITYSFRTRQRSAPVDSLLNELFTGVENWTIEEKQRQVCQLLELRKLLDQKNTPSINSDIQTRFIDYFKDFELVKNSWSENKSLLLLWKRDLSGYQQSALVANRLKNSGKPSSNNDQTLDLNGKHYIWIKDSAYEVQHTSQGWRVIHPLDKSAFRPPVMHSTTSGWHLPQ
ncbi:dermonecrotic toxin domain-containing protein [Pseudomonas fluorescens]|uniref:dermonecrotic toxin domain-containing protein n=1 Tax=Pseudomonas fluorescens TaxID=294 RepID=UPI00123EEFF7|nr:DUF6543 domain-containing protein [Pseudomonas fluorescens]VVO66768.1 hypothetical protein PS898_01072 [Pseudomonas fluorescens]